MSGSDAFTCPVARRSAKSRVTAPIAARIDDAVGLQIFAEIAWHKWYSQADFFLRRHPKARIKCLGAGGAAARSHSSGATPAEKERHVADVAAFDALELGGRYRALRERVPCRSRYLSNQ